MLPSIFGERLFDDFFGDPFMPVFNNRHDPLFGKNARNLMKTDVRETESTYELDIDLPGFKKDEVKIELDGGYLTISAAITGLIFGFMLYGKKVSLLRVVLAKLIHTLLVGMLLNSFWLSMLYGNAFPLVFLGRLPKELVMFPIQTAMIYILLKAFEKAKVGKLAGLATE